MELDARLPSSLPPDEGREVFWVEYDLENFFEPFMKFKETVFGNDQVPYVRYIAGRARGRVQFHRPGRFPSPPSRVMKAQPPETRWYASTTSPSFTLTLP